MEVIYGLEHIPEIKNPVVTTGSFDGVHVGHQYIINRLSQLAGEIDGSSVLVTFSPHPRKVLFPENNLKMISSQEEKIEFLRQTKLDYLIIIDFTVEFSKTPSIDFIKEILVGRIGARKIVIGYDHHFGHDRKGDFENLYKLATEYGFEVEEISAQGIEFEVASSTKIREAISNGNIQRANAFLQHYYTIIGVFSEGRAFKKGHDFTTIKININDSSKQLPSDGVYAVSFDVQGNSYKGMLNVKSQPEESSPEGKIIEAHIFNLDKDIIGEKGIIFFHKKIREEMRFETRNELEKQLKQDKEHINNLIF